MRDNTISITKGIAIIFVVVYHSFFPTEFLDWRMVIIPLFFFVSGYCFKEKYYDDVKTYAKRRVMGVYWPYIKWGIFFLLLHNVFFHLNIYGDGGYLGRVSLYTTSDFLSHLLSITTKMQGNEKLVGSYWFMKPLFVGSFIFFFTSMAFRRRSVWGCFLLLFIAVGLSFLDWKVPHFNIGTRDFFAAFFIYCGYLYKKSQWSIHKSPWVWVVAVVLQFFGVKYWFTTMHDYTYDIMLPYVASALPGILTVFCLCQYLSQKNNLVVRFLSYTGNHTLEILTWHFLSMKLVSLLIIAIYGLSIKRLSEIPAIKEYAVQGWWIAYSVIGVAVPLAGSWLYQTAKEKIRSRFATNRQNAE